MKASELFGKAKWVSPMEQCDTPYIRGEFAAEKEIQKASITICGLGWFMLYLNGRKVGDELFTPANTDYQHCPEMHYSEYFGEVLSHRIYCLEYDITDYLFKESDACNCIGVALAPGWYKTNTEVPDEYGLGYSYGYVKLCFRIQLLYTDGTREEVLSGEDLKWSESPLVHYTLRLGERYDYNSIRMDGWNVAGFDDSEWYAVESVEAPVSEYYLQDCLPDRVIRHITPKLIHETEDAYIYDVGENITGTPVVKQRGNAVEEIIFRCSERLNPDKTIEENTMHNQESRFVTDGMDREYRLQFSWFGFRYVSVSKNAVMTDCEVIHTDVAVTSAFRSDNELLNWLYDAYIRTQLDNIHCCIPSDCPHLEKQGYTGDGQLTAQCCMMLLDSRKMYDKWLGDISDCQDTISGHVQYCAPYIWCGGGPGGWGCAIIEVPYLYYQMYGDKSVLEEFLPKTLHYFDYLEAHSEEELVTSDQPGLWCLGDWCTPEKIAIPAPFVNNYFYIKSLNRTIETCRILGKEELIPGLEARKAVKIQALEAHYYNAETGDYAENIQGANAFAIDLGLGDERTLDHMVERYRSCGMYDTGIFGTDIVTRVLFEKGYNNEAFQLLTSKGKYSFYNWMVSGSTTLPEYWTFKRSQNHPMFGAVVKYLFIYLLGIVNEGVAYENILIEPRFVEGMDRAEGYLTTERGKISVKYEKIRDEDSESADAMREKVSVTVEIPESVSARFRYQGKEQSLAAGVNELVFYL